MNMSTLGNLTMLAMALVAMSTRREAKRLSVGLALIFLFQHPQAFGQARVSPIRSNVPCDLLHDCAIQSSTPALNSTSVKIVADTSLAAATKVYFGTTAAPSFSVNSDGSLTVAVPNLPPGSSVPVSAQLPQGMLYGKATYSTSVASMGMSGPLPVPPPGPAGQGSDPAWAISTISGIQQRNHSFSYAQNSPNLMYTTWPTFHISVTFQNLSASYPDTGPPWVNTGIPGSKVSNWGNMARFTAQLQMCSVSATEATATPPATACTNWDGNSGFWVNAGAPATSTLTLSGTADSHADLAVNAGPPVMDPQDLVRILRFQLSMQQGDSFGPSHLDRADSATTNPFTAIVAPAAYLQVKVMPLAIVYSPPGNQSSVSFSTTSAYNTSYNLASSDTVTNKATDDEQKQLNFTAEEGAKASGGGGSASATISFGGGESWDNTTSTVDATQSGQQTSGSSAQGVAIQYGISPNPLNVPGSGQVCTSTADCSMTSVDPNWLANLPFWNDLFVLQIHPQYALYVLGAGKDRTTFYRDTSVVAEATVLQLWECAYGQTAYGLKPCQIQYSDYGIISINGGSPVYQGNASTVILTPDEATNLLKLDPFYLSMSQNPKLDAARALPVSSEAYGSMIGQTTVDPVNVNVNNTEVQGSQTTGQTTHTASVSSAYSDTSSLSGTLSIAFILSAGFTGQFQQSGKYTEETDTQTVFSDSTAVSTNTVTQASVVLSDISNQTIGSGGSLSCKTCHNPLPRKPSVNIYLDRMFGGFMFQDPAAVPSNLPASNLNAETPGFNLGAMDLAQEQRIQRFSDVTNSMPGKAAIGLAARYDLIRGYGDGSFHPTDPITRSQLAVALAAALKLPQNEAGTPFVDVAANDEHAPAIAAAAKAGLLVTPAPNRLSPSEAVPRQELATSLARGFSLSAAASVPSPSDLNTASPTATEGIRAVIDAGYMLVDPNGAFQPTAVATRAEAIQAIVAAFTKTARTSGR
jgi:S-layer homology domain